MELFQVGKDVTIMIWMVNECTEESQMFSMHFSNIGVNFTSVSSDMMSQPHADDFLASFYH